MKLLLAVSFSALMLLQVTAVKAGEHAHMAAFFNNGSNANFKFPAVIKGDNVEQDMLKLGAEMMIFAHSAGIHDGDVWSLQNNTLREVEGKFRDFGVGCELSLRKPPFKVGGLCSVFMSQDAGAQKTRNIIAPMLIKDEVVWYRIFKDDKNGVAGYFMRETAADFNH
ncbi:MAG: hypothetical protein Q9M19_01850 [Mariprofundaceae bacterium]|nr:hypothetical protein [Mariprofundaceae bacterium]